MGESLQQERESPWAFTLTERVPGAFEILLADWPEKFSGQSEGGIEIRHPTLTLSCGSRS